MYISCRIDRRVQTTAVSNKYQQRHQHRQKKYFTETLLPSLKPAVKKFLLPCKPQLYRYRCHHHIITWQTIVMDESTGMWWCCVLLGELVCETCNGITVSAASLQAGRHLTRFMTRSSHDRHLNGQKSCYDWLCLEFCLGCVCKIGTYLCSAMRNCWKISAISH